MKPRKPVVPKPAVAKAKPKPKPKPATPAVDPYFAKLQEETRKRMQAASEPGRRNYKPGQSTGDYVDPAAKRAGYLK